MRERGERERKREKSRERERKRERMKSVFCRSLSIGWIEDEYFHQKSPSFSFVATCRIQPPAATFFVLAVGPKMLFNLNFLREHVLRCLMETIL